MCVGGFVPAGLDGQKHPRKKDLISLVSLAAVLMPP